MVLTLTEDDGAFLRSRHRMTDAEHEAFNTEYGVESRHDAPTPALERFQDHAGNNGH